MTWWAPNEDKAWAERFFLATSPLWIGAVATVVLTGWVRDFDDAGYLVFSLACAAPTVVGPLIARGGLERQRPIHECYWFKLNLWAFVLVCFGTYFGTHYFFDLMGMRYAFPARWSFDAELVGHGDQAVPVFMYPLTQAYFVTYFTVGPLALRALRRRLALGRFGTVVAVVALAYAIAFAETFFMASDHLRDLFSYADTHRMLALGSFGYAAYFVVGLPMVARMDEAAERWSLGRVVVEALAACMLILCLLEAWAKLVGPL